MCEIVALEVIYAHLNRAIPTSLPSPIQFRNQYDNDITTWSPQGRIHQIEYAMEAVNQGSCIIGIKSKTHAMLFALKVYARSFSLSSHECGSAWAHIGYSWSCPVWANAQKLIVDRSPFPYANTHALPVARHAQRSANELSQYQKKLLRIDDHIGVAIAGLTSDARVLRYGCIPICPRCVDGPVWRPLCAGSLIG